ncbi:MAG: M23 family metallopeptidase [Clostridiales bacterium]|nr:M23 family metallopeptidase [Clostridiales bacterium]
MKKNVITVLLIAVMFIPSIIAVANYAYLKNTPIEYRNVSKLDITDLADTVFHLDKENSAAEKEDLQFFISLNKNAKSVDALPTDIAQTKPFIFTYYNYAVKTDYQYYFSLSAENAYYVNNTGGVYKISPSDATSFICSYYARSLYEGAELPQLTLSDTNPVTPATMNWNFRNVKSQYVNYAPTYTTTKSVNSYDVSSNFAMKFSVQPDFFYITITQNNEEIYKGDYDALAIPAALDLGKPAIVEINAEWYESVSQVYAGEATYRFEANLVPPPLFSMVSSDGDFVEEGSVLAITGKNIKDINEIVFSSSPEISYTPTWFSDDETGSVYTLVPISIYEDYGNVSEFTFTIETGGSSTVVTLPYQKKRFDTLKGLSEANYQNDFAEISEQIGTPADSSILFAGGFANPVSSTSGLKGFGRIVDNSYKHNGVDFTNVTSGDNIHAGASGTIAYIGDLSSGDTVVVIEHGLGLRSWYVKMASVDSSLAVGSTVTKGDVIGTCLSGNLHCSITVFGVPVSPYKFWSFTSDNTEFLDLK